MALRRTASDPAAELVELREAEPIGTLDHHDAGIGDVDAHLDHRRRDKDLDLSRYKAFHDVFLFFEPAENQAHTHRFWIHITLQAFNLIALVVAVQRL